MVKRNHTGSMSIYVGPYAWNPAQANHQIQRPMHKGREVRPDHGTGFVIRCETYEGYTRERVSAPDFCSRRERDRISVPGGLASRGIPETTCEKTIKEN
jgi:hypothetical protein